MYPLFFLPTNDTAVDMSSLLWCMLGNDSSYACDQSEIGSLPIGTIEVDYKYYIINEGQEVL